MKYEIRKSGPFDEWMSQLKDRIAIRAIAMRMTRAISGNFGDSKALGGGLFEMRIFVGKGYRIYYTVRDGELVFLLYGGHKGTQGKDIAKARELLNELE